MEGRIYRLRTMIIIKAEQISSIILNIFNWR